MKHLLGTLIILASTVAGTIVGPQSAAAADKKVLYIALPAGNYAADGANAFDEVAALAGPGNATYLVLTQANQVVNALAADTYEQIWFYDLSTADDAFPADYQAIADWFTAGAIKQVICDGRYLSSFWNGRYTGEGRTLTENYYQNLAIRGGGIMIGTDHNSYASAGANTLNAALGLNGFTGNFGGSFPLDAGHPLTSSPNVISALSNDSSTSQAPFGVQPSGRTLHTIGYHSGEPLNPGISTTIDGGSLSFTVEASGDSGTVCDGDVSFTTAITSGEDLGPFTYEWFVDGVSIGTGSTLTNYDISGLASGNYVFRVVALGLNGRADDDAITIATGDDNCGCAAGAGPLCDAGGAAFVIPVEGPVDDQFVICRMVPAGSGTPVAAEDEFRCDDIDGNGIVDLFSGGDITNYFGAGFCGAL